MMSRRKESLAVIALCSRVQTFHPRKARLDLLNTSLRGISKTNYVLHRANRRIVFRDDEQPAGLSGRSRVFYLFGYGVAL
jgi:hypothetical protein